MKTFDGQRHHIVSLLPDESIGIELGVARGIYSERMIRSGKFNHFYGVDMYADDNHSVSQYIEAIHRVGLHNPYTLFRMTFEEALDIFPDDYFDFVYVDGYAHTGEEGGKTIEDWYDKVKPGGILAGDDYHERWALVIESVNRFCEKNNYEVTVTTEVEDKEYCYYPTWFIEKRSELENN